jgi:ATP-binding cassette subfamily C protein CydC
MAGQLPAQVQQVLHSDARCAQADERLYQSEAAAAQAYGAVSGHYLERIRAADGLVMEQGRINAPVAALGILLALSAMEPFAALRRGAEQAGRTWLALRRLAPPLAAKAEAGQRARSSPCRSWPSACSLSGFVNWGR